MTCKMNFWKMNNLRETVFARKIYISGIIGGKSFREELLITVVRMWRIHSKDLKLTQTVLLVQRILFNGM